MLGYSGRQPSSARAFWLDSGSLRESIRARYGDASRSSHAGMAIGDGAPAAAESVRTTSLKLIASSSTMSNVLPASARSSAVAN